MSIPNEALQKVKANSSKNIPCHGIYQLPQLRKSANTIPVTQLFQEIESRALASQQQINLTKTQMSAKQRDIRMLQLTSKELSELPDETRVYEGVGKMYALPSILSLFSVFFFLFSFCFFFFFNFLEGRNLRLTDNCQVRQRPHRNRYKASRP